MVADWPEVTLAFNLAIIGALASPGPAFIVMIRASVAGGRRQAMATGFGLATMAVLWSLTAMAGINILFQAVPAAYLTIKIAGAAYLIWLALSLWRHADRPIGVAPPRGPKGFALGFLTNLANPKAVVFIAAIFATILPQEIPHAMQAQILFNHFALEIIWYTAMALMLTTAPARAAYLKAKARLDRVAAVVLGALAVRVAT
jgi:threonine/homoserine/homoserine lactone efflux protein